MESSDPSISESVESTADRDIETGKAELLDIIQKADLATAGPDARAMKVWEVLKASPKYAELSTWDIVCFAGAGVAMFHQFHPWLEDAAKKLAAITHTIHYANYELIVKQEAEAEAHRQGG